jgi:type IV secretory pathway VirB10-like protein
MSDAIPDPRSPGEPPVPDKALPPGLSARAPRPRAVRLRGSVVRLVMIGGVVLVSGALAWAFVVQPELRVAARDRAVEDQRDEARRGVRPADAVIDQPASYDRLPPPRTAQTEDPPAPAESAASARAPRAARDDGRAASSALSLRRLAAQSSLFFAEPASASGRAASPEPVRAAPARAEASAASVAYNPHRLTAPVSPYELKAGAMVPAVLLTAIDTARPGPVVATVTQNVFDTISGRYLLLPQGARLIGASEGESRYGDRRAFIAWERVILPNGKSLLLDGEAGVDAQGAVGVRGRVERRLFPLALGTLFGGAITALGQAARDDDRGGGLLGDAGDAAAIEGAQVGGRLVDRELNVRPSIRLDAGAPVRVMITRDLVLEPYQP